MLLYPSSCIAYLIAIIFLASETSAFSISYSSFIALKHSSAVAFSSISLSFLNLATFSSETLNAYGFISIIKSSTYESPFCSNTFITFKIVWFNVLSSILVLYKSTLNPIVLPTIVFPDLSNIEPLSASIVLSRVNLVFDCSLYSLPWTICRLKSCNNKIIPTTYIIVVIKLNLSFIFGFLLN